MADISTSIPEKATFSPFSPAKTFVSLLNNITMTHIELILKIALAIIFGLAAFVKFAGKSKKSFQKLPLGIPLMYATAFAEIVFAAGLFTSYDFWAIIGLLAIIAGAIGSLIIERVPLAKYGMAFFSLILLVALLLVNRGV
jgi:hypothetical protein